VREWDAATYRRGYTVGAGARFPLERGCYGNDTLGSIAPEPVAQANSVVLFRLSLPVVKKCFRGVSRSGEHSRKSLEVVVVERTNLNSVVGLDDRDLRPRFESEPATQRSGNHDLSLLSDG